MLERGPPYPQVILPQFGGYWIEDPETLPTSNESNSEEKDEGETPPGDYGYHLDAINEAVRAYRKHFLGRVRLYLFVCLFRCNSVYFSPVTCFYLSGASELLLLCWQFGKPSALCETQRGKRSGVPPCCYQVNINTNNRWALPAVLPATSTKTSWKWKPFLQLQFTWWTAGGDTCSYQTKWRNKNMVSL